MRLMVIQSGRGKFVASRRRKVGNLSATCIGKCHSDLRTEHLSGFPSPVVTDDTAGRM